MPNQKKVAIIVNSAAKSGQARAQVHEAKRALWGWPLEFFFPPNAGELISVCSRLDVEHYEAVIMIGGDGTQHIAIPILLQSRVPLIPFPGGTANDLARELGVSEDWNQIQSLLDLRKKRQIDVITANGTPFATVAGIGVGSILTQEFNERRSQSPLFRKVAAKLSDQIYPLMAAKVILTHPDYGYRLKVRADRFSENCVESSALFICNQSYLGGKLKVAPSIDNADRTFHVLFIARTGRFEVLRALQALQKGDTPQDFIQFSTKRMVIEDLDQKPIRIFGDGEIFIESQRVVFEVAPSLLEVYADMSQSGKKGFLI